MFNATDDANTYSATGHNDRSDAENVLIVYTDGVFHDEYVAREKIESLKRQGVRVVVIGLGQSSRRPAAKTLLESLATRRSDVYLVNLHKSSLAVEQELNEVAQHVKTLDCVNLYPGKLFSFAGSSLKGIRSSLFSKTGKSYYFFIYKNGEHCKDA